MVMPLDLLCFKNLPEIHKDNLPHGLSWMSSRIIVEKTSGRWKRYLSIFSTARAVRVVGAYVDQRFGHTHCQRVPQHVAIAFQSGIVFFRHGATDCRYRTHFEKIRGKKLLEKWERDDFNMSAYVHKIVERQIESQMEPSVSIGEYYWNIAVKKMIHGIGGQRLRTSDEADSKLAKLMALCMEKELTWKEIACTTHPFSFCLSGKNCVKCNENYPFLFEPYHPQLM